MTCWIGVAAAEHVQIATASGFAMFAHGRHEAARKVLDRDWVTYYAPRERMDEGGIVRAFVAIGEAIPGAMAEHEMRPGISGWTRPMRWLKSRPASIYFLLDELSFVKDRSHWGMYFRKSLFSVPSTDFERIAAAMNVEFTA